MAATDLVSCQFCVEAMALVGGMGEAVLPYGDGIASEGRVQDCSVFDGKIKDIFVKDVRYEKAPLISGEYKPQTREQHGPFVAEAGAHVEDILATADEGQSPCCPEPARSMNGHIEHVNMNGHVNGLEEEAEGEEDDGEAADGKPVGAKRRESRLLQSGFTECDRIVESVIQSLDEKVLGVVHTCGPVKMSDLGDGGGERRGRYERKRSMVCAKVN